MIDLLLAPAGFAIGFPLLAYMIYRLWRERPPFASAALRGLKWLVVFLLLAILLNAGIVLARLSLIVINSCDLIDTTAPVANPLGDTAQGRLEACKILASTENYSVVLQTHARWPLWSPKTLIGYAPEGDHDPVLRWIDEKTLSVDLGRVSWVSSRIDKAGDIRIVYTYTLVAPPP